jgi:NAD(P)H-hydrate epimerase
MEAAKIGLLRFPAFILCGEIVAISIGLESAITSEQAMRVVIDDDWVRERLPTRPRTAHKGTFGTVMIVGGCANYVGAPLLSGLAAYRTGSGLVSLAVPQSVHGMLAGQFLEAVWLVLNDEGGVISESAAELVEAQLMNIKTLVIGPGIGREETTSRFLDAIMFSPKTGSKNRRVGFLVEQTNTEKLERRLPAIVLDADGLRWLAEQDGWAEKIQTSLVLTPHPGEMAALTGLTVEEIQNERMGIAALYAKRWKQVIVLKGALTVIAAPDGRLAVIPVASSALAKAGSGDVLSGMIASLIGQGMGDFEAASTAAWIHARAGLEAANQQGSEVSILASDIIDSIAKVFAALN